MYCLSPPLAVRWCKKMGKYEVCTCEKKKTLFSKFDVYIWVLANAYIIEAEVFATILAGTEQYSFGECL